MRPAVTRYGLYLVPVAAALAAITALGPAATRATGANWSTPTYRADDFGDGLVRSVLPAGENGLMNGSELAVFEATGARPPGSQDQLARYANLLYAGPGLTNAKLSGYYDDESFGVRRADITATVRPNPKVKVVIYYDEHRVPHIYGASDQALAYGAGWAAAHDRLFLMDVLRHYGSGTLSQFLGPSCADEQMDHDQLLTADYTTAEANAQIAALPKEYGTQGTRLVAMGKAYVAGINDYIAATATHPALLPADYVAVGAPPQKWSPADVISVASLMGGIFGRGCGSELSNAALLRYLDRQLGTARAGQAAFAAFKEQNDPSAPTTVAARFPSPSLTTSPQSWMTGAEQVEFTFNWFYVDNRHIAYYQSGADPIRPSDVNPNLPTWGTGVAEWRGFLPAAAHPHVIDPAQGFLTSWNNKPAPGFSAADDNYTYGPVQRVQSLNQEIIGQFAAHHGKLTEANLVTAMETAASADLTGRQVAPVLLAETASQAEPAGVATMLSRLRAWVADGALRRKPGVLARGDDPPEPPAASHTQYAHAAAIAIMDELWPRLIRAVFDPLFAPGGVDQADGVPTGYSAFPMSFEDTPNGGGAHHGSSYQSGWDGYLVKILDQVLGRPVSQPFPATVTSRVCRGGLATCPAAIDAALAATYQALVAANGGSTHVARWTRDTASKAAGQTMPVYDQIQFTSIGIVGQPAIDWQNRPTFQQVAQFPAHRP